MVTTTKNCPDGRRFGSFVAVSNGYVTARNAMQTALRRLGSHMIDGELVASSLPMCFLTLGQSSGQKACTRSGPTSSSAKLKRTAKQYVLAYVRADDPDPHRRRRIVATSMPGVKVRVSSRLIRSRTNAGVDARRGRRHGKPESCSTDGRRIMLNWLRF
jgi:hypothetical protein